MKKSHQRQTGDDAVPLREVWNGAGTSLIATYSCDADGRRVRKDLASGTDIDYLYDGWRAIEWRYTTAPYYPMVQMVFGNYLDVVLEYDWNDMAAPDNWCDKGFRWAQQNALYSVYGWSDLAAQVRWAFEYDPYGAATEITEFRELLKSLRPLAGRR